MQITKNKIFIILLLFIFTNFSTLLYAEVAKKDCSLIKNLYKKMICKTNNATATINAKKKLTDYLPNDLLKKKE